MKEIYVRNGIMGGYTAITKEEWIEATTKEDGCEGNVTIMFAGADTAINLLFWAPLGCDPEYCIEAAGEYCSYVHSITGMHISIKSIA